MPYTALIPKFASGSVEVRREVEAYSLGSLVADCGGVLGLFIGFNFLMIWEKIVDILRRYPLIFFLVRKKDNRMK